MRVIATGVAVAAGSAFVANGATFNVVKTTSFGDSKCDSELSTYVSFDDMLDTCVSYPSKKSVKATLKKSGDVTFVQKELFTTENCAGERTLSSQNVELGVCSDFFKRVQVEKQSLDDTKVFLTYADFSGALSEATFCKDYDPTKIWDIYKTSSMNLYEGRFSNADSCFVLESKSVKVLSSGSFNVYGTGNCTGSVVKTSNCLVDGSFGVYAGSSSGALSAIQSLQSQVPVTKAPTPMTTKSPTNEGEDGTGDGESPSGASSSVVSVALLSLFSIFASLIR